MISKSTLIKSLAILGLLQLNTSAMAAFIPDPAELAYDITSLTRLGTFSVTDVAGTSGQGATATNWTLTDTSSWSTRTTTNNSWSFASIPGETTDRLHMGLDFTITFDRNVTSILFAFEDNDTIADGGFDFGLIPTEIGGSNISLSGSRMIIAGSGGWALFTGLNTTSLSHTRFNSDGVDIAWFVLDSQPVSSVPVPAAVWLFGSGLLALSGFARRKIC